MTGDKISGVLYAHAAFNARFDEVSKYAENGNNGTAQHCKRQVQGIELRRPKNSPDNHGTNNATKKSFPAFLGRNLGRHFMFAQTASHDIGKRIAYP